jgi:hypothetical protein
MDIYYNKISLDKNALKSIKKGFKGIFSKISNVIKNY